MQVAAVHSILHGHSPRIVVAPTHILTKCNLFVTYYYMNILMDADCLIKLTKAGLKDPVCKYFRIFIPAIVKMEVVDAGKQHQCSDAVIVEKNIQNGKIIILKSQQNYSNGDSALISLFEDESYDAVGTDDAKLTRKLKTAGIPFVLPGIIVYKLAQEKKLTAHEAVRSLEKLSEFISEDEFSTVIILLEKKDES